MSNTEKEIAQTYKAVINFEFEFLGEDHMKFNEITSRDEAYAFIRESVAQTILGMGFDSFSDIVDAVEIFESVEKL